MRGYDTFPSVLDLVTVGEAFDDYIFHGLSALPAPGRELKTDNFVKTIGGGAVITAIAAARIGGARCGIVSALSRDAAARLRRERVAVKNLRRGTEPIAITVALSTARDRRFITYNGANSVLGHRLRLVVPRLRARHVHFAFDPRPCKPWIRIVECLRADGCRTSWDFGWNESLVRDREFARLCQTVDVLFVNRDEERLYRPKLSANLIVTKLGAAGARAVGPGFAVRTAHLTRHTTAVDTTGAGDVFNAGFIVARLRGASITDALHAANRVAAKSTERVG